MTVLTLSQKEVYEEIAPLVRSCADGYNACIFAYGQTGSGARGTSLLLFHEQNAQHPCWASTFIAACDTLMLGHVMC